MILTREHVEETWVGSFATATWQKPKSTTGISLNGYTHLCEIQTSNNGSRKCCMEVRRK